LAILPSPVPSYPPALLEQGGTLVTTTIGREFPTVKSLNYIGAILAMREAAEVGAIEALYVDGEGRGLECTRSNFVGVQDGRLLTPRAGVLAGITLAAVIDLAPEVVVVNTAVPLADLDEAFITSSTKGVMPVTAIDGRAVGDGRPGPLTLALRHRLEEMVWHTGED
jgi:branched-chain amino acid aminotransferase